MVGWRASGKVILARERANIKTRHWIHAGSGVMGFGQDELILPETIPRRQISLCTLIPYTIDSIRTRRLLVYQLGLSATHTVWHHQARHHLYFPPARQPRRRRRSSMEALELQLHPRTISVVIRFENTEEYAPLTPSPL